MHIVNSLLETTIYSAILFGMIMLFKALFKKHLSPILSYIIWFLLIARLVMPITFDVGFRIPFMQIVQMQGRLDAVLSNKTNLTSDNIPSSGSDYAEAANLMKTSPQNNNGLPGGVSEIANKQTGSKSPAPVSLDWASILIAIWLGGAVLSLLYFFITYLKLMRLIKFKSIRIS